VAGPAAQPQSFASGRYSVRRLIGEGGQKIVYLARDTQLDRDVAIAVLKTEGLDVVGLCSQVETSTRLAREIRQSLFLWFDSIFMAMRGMLEGWLDEADRLVQQALALGQRVGEQGALQAFGAQMFMLRWEQGRLQELEPVFSNFVEAYPAVRVFGSVRALIYAEFAGIAAGARSR
jgi:hypothetical protein